MLRRRVGFDQPDGRTEHFVQRLEQLAIAFGQVGVGRRDMHSATDERIQERGQHSGEGLSFAGLHFGNRLGREDQSGLQLHVVELDADRSLRSLGDERERGGQRVRIEIKRARVVQTGSQIIRAVSEFSRRQIRQLRSTRSDVGNQSLRIGHSARGRTSRANGAINGGRSIEKCCRHGDVIGSGIATVPGRVGSPGSELSLAQS